MPCIEDSRSLWRASAGRIFLINPADFFLWAGQNADQHSINLWELGQAELSDSPTLFLLHWFSYAWRPVFVKPLARKNRFFLFYLKFFTSLNLSDLIRCNILFKLYYSYDTSTLDNRQVSSPKLSLVFIFCDCTCLRAACRTILYVQSMIFFYFYILFQNILLNHFLVSLLSSKSTNKWYFPQLCPKKSLTNV